MNPKTFLANVSRHALCTGYSFLDKSGLYRPLIPPVNFVIEKADWSIRWDGKYITTGVNAISPGTSGFTENPERLNNRVVHFGSHYMWGTWGRHMSASNRYVVTYFHGKREDGPEAARSVDQFLESLSKVERVITAATVMERRLLEWGVPRQKLVRIPIGVDTSLFRPPTMEERRSIRKKLGIRDDQICIGSFQKDGVGWNEGLEPKHIKGPDIFLEVIRKLKKEVPVFVLLTGPARGFVKRGLENMGVPYAHEFVRNYPDLVNYYHALDIYPVTSREEGGPKAIMESMATGVPIVSTKVGMAPDLIEDDRNGRMVPVEDIKGLSECCLEIIQGQGLSDLMKKNALKTIAGYDWSIVAQRHYDQVYAPLINIGADS